MGNDAADKRDKAALSEHDLRGDIRKKVIDDNDWAAKVAGELGKRLAEWPTTHQLFGELGKVSPPVGNKSKTEKKQHCFSYVEGQIRCTACNFLPRKGVASHKSAKVSRRPLLRLSEMAGLKVTDSKRLEVTVACARFGAPNVGATQGLSPRVWPRSATECQPRQALGRSS